MSALFSVKDKAIKTFYKTPVEQLKRALAEAEAEVAGSEVRTEPAKIQSFIQDDVYSVQLRADLPAEEMNGVATLCWFKDEKAVKLYTFDKVTGSIILTSMFDLFHCF